MTEIPASEKLREMRERTARTSNASTVSNISTAGTWASRGLIASGAYAAASSGGFAALKCFAGRLAVPIAGAMAGAWLAEKVGADEAVLSVAEKFGAQRLSGPSRRAAHLLHQIAHSNAFVGLLAGIATGIVVGVLVFAAAAAIIGTGGMALPLVGAAVMFGSTAAGAFTTTAIAGAGAKSGTMTGPISSGSPNVTFEGKPAARVTDTAACTKDPGTPPVQIIEGSETIFINDLPMARQGHKLSCNAVVQQGCDTIFGDDTTGSYGTPNAEFSVLEQTALSLFEVIGSRSSSRKGGLVDKILRRVLGEPVDIVTGDYADERTDYEYGSVLPLRLSRTYPGRMHVEGALGPRWICNWSQRLVFDPEDGTAVLEDADGQRLVFALGDSAQINSTHLMAPYYRLTGTRDRLRLFDSRTGQFLVFTPASATVSRLTAIEDRNANRIDFHYDGHGHLRRVEHSDGLSFRVETTPQGWLRSLWLAGEDQPLVRYDYAETGGLTRVVGAFSGEFNYRYTVEGWLSHWRDSGPTQAEIMYDLAGRVVGTRTGDGMFNDRFLYFPEQRLSRYVDATGATSSYWYDANNMVVCEEDPLGRRTHQEWDALERLQSRTDAAGRTTNFTHDAAGRRTAAVDWADRATTWEYDRWGALTAHATSDGDVSTWTYDDRGNVVAWTQAGMAGSYAYDERGRCVNAIGPGGAVTAWEHDSAGRLRLERDPRGRETQFQWDRYGRTAAITDPAGRTTRFDHKRSPANPRGALSRIVAPDGGETRFEYDGEGMLAAQIRGEGQTTRFVYGAFDTLRRSVDPAGIATDFGYDGAGRLDSVTDAAGHQWQFRYDPAGQLEAQVDWAGRETRYRRDDLGRLIAKRLPDGGEQAFEWDERDRIVRVRAGGDVIGYRYDDADRLVEAKTYVVKDGADRVVTSVELAYDGQGRLAEEKQNGVATTYRYDDAGRCVGRTSPSGETSMAFDPSGLLEGYESNGHRLRFGYDPSGLETLRETAPLGARTAFQLRQGYDPCGRLLDQRAGRAPTFGASTAQTHEPAVARRYAWDRSGRLVGVGDGRGGDVQYRYDGRDQAVAVERPGRAESYRYDALMNLAESLAGEHRYWRDCVVKAGSESFRYDACGRMVERISAPDGFRPRRWRYAWDGFDRMVALEEPDGQRWRYAYDAFGRRVRKHGGADARRVDYLWQGETLAEAWDQAATDGARRLIVERWHYEPGSFTPLAKEVLPPTDASLASELTAELVTTDSRWLPVVADQLGTPKALFDAEGTCVWQAEHDLWGRARAARDLLRDRAGDAPGNADDATTHGGDGPCALRFPGQWADEESGLHYNLNRYYDPATGQYLSPDPIGLDGGLRTNGYVHDPLGWHDPNGLADAPGTIKYPIGNLTPEPGTRGTGVNRAWAQEQNLVRETGSGTVNWTASQRAELLRTGKVEGYTGHHINNVASNPAWQGDPRNIRLLQNGKAGTPNDHVHAPQGHRGTTRNNTSGRLIDRNAMIERFKASC